MPEVTLQTLPTEWVSAPLGNFYIQGDNYVSIIIADEQVISEEQKSEIIQKYKSQFLENCFKFFYKIPALNLSDVKLENNYIDPFPNMGEKLLFSISASKVDSASDLQFEESENLNVVEYGIEEYYNKTSFVIRKFNEYQKEYIEDVYKNKIIGYENLDFNLESEKLTLFNNNLSKLASVNKVNIGEYDRIEFSYTEQNFLEKILLINNEEKKGLYISFSYFKKSSPQDRVETNRFILNLEKLYRSCKKTNNTYQDVIQQNFENTPKKTTSYSNTINRSSNSGDTYGTTNTDVDNNFSASKELSRKFSAEIQKVATRSLYTTPCLTPEDRDKKKQELKDGQREQNNFADQLTYTIGDTFINNLPEILQKVGDEEGKKASQALGGVLNRLGVCGLGDIVSMVANTVTSFLDPQEYSEELTKCALDKLDNRELERLNRSLAEIDNNGPQILERYRQIVGSPDILPPWKTGGYQSGTGVTNDTYRLSRPITSEDKEGFDSEYLFAAYKDSIVFSVKTESLLDALVSTFPDEMGWLSFFTNATDILLEKCAGINSSINAGSKIDLNFCKEKPFKMAKISNVGMVPSGPISASAIADQLIEELKNIIIELIIKLITSTMQQLFQIVAAGVSFDQNYFKRGDHIPDLFQNENYMHNNFKKSASNKKRTNNDVNDSVRSMLLASIATDDVELSLEKVNKLLKDTSVSLGEYEKINLLKGEGTEQAYAKFRYIAKKNGLEKFFRNDTDVEKFFLMIGSRLDVPSMEKEYFDSIYNYNPWSSFCIIDSDMLDRAYKKNKNGITDKQIDEMKEKLKDIQKDKLCFMAETMGNSSGPILGELSKMITDKNSPIYNKVKNQESQYFLDAIEESKKMLASSYNTDLYKSKGVFDVSMSIIENLSPVGYNEKSISKTLGALLNPLALVEFKTTDIISQIKPDINTPTIGSDEIGDLIDLIKEESPNLTEVEKTSLVNYYIARASQENVQIYLNYLSSNFKLLKEVDWEDGPYNNLEETRAIMDIMSLSQEKIKKAYNVIDEFQIPKSKNIPFNLLKSKQDLVVKYFYLSSLVLTLYTEFIFKSLDVFRSFEKDATLENSSAIKYISNSIMTLKDPETIIDNAIQILFKLPYQEKHEEKLAEIAEISNNSINQWLSGGFSTRSEFYDSVDTEAALSIFIDVILENYEQEKINSLFKESNKGVKSLKNIAYREERLYDIVTGRSVREDHPSGTSMRNERYFFVGTPIDSKYPSGVVSIPQLQSSIGSKELEGNIEDIWPEGWRPGIRISSSSPYDSSIDPSDLVNLSVRNSEGTWIIIPLASYLGDKIEGEIPENVSNIYPEEELRQSFLTSEKFKKFYTSMNIEDIISNYTNYYVGQTNSRIDDMNSKGFFKMTKKILSELS
tara:strand:+ start:13872 stop:18032 length:4161 start_codon:yes stop_codon:yes gene_type:complete